MGGKLRRFPGVPGTHVYYPEMCDRRMGHRRTCVPVEEEPVVPTTFKIETRFNGGSWEYTLLTSSNGTDSPFYKSEGWQTREQAKLAAEEKAQRIALTEMAPETYEFTPEI